METTDANSIVEKIRIPPGNIPYLLFQGQAQSMYRFPILKKLLFNRFPKLLSYKKVVGLETQWFPQRIRKEAIFRVKKHYEEIRPYLPRTASRILDIASGQGLINVFLYDYFQNPDLEIHLLDRFSLDSEITYGFQQTASSYSSARDAIELMESNGIKNVTIHAVHDNNMNCSGQFEVIISLAGWGFMFPVNGYLDQVYDLARPGGIVITDLRKGIPEEKEQETLIRKKWQDFQVISEWKKSRRILLRK